ncbi:MAG TPA: RagB/SusD family nutrient uptake outer membrane protein, partial [Balneolales bacterium]|nr:RagB/SusD family nutrient uptake outer membrane protein [Balneolales bacterium]
QHPGDNLRPPRTKPSDIYNKVIIPDLKKAIQLLPAKSSYSGSDIGRASKGSATGLLAKVYLTIANMQKFAGKKYDNQSTNSDYQQVVKLCDQVTQLGYKLDANYADNFNPNHENDQESLFSVQYYGKTSNSFWSNENQSSWTSTFMGPRNSNMVAGAYGWDQPTQEFVNAYEKGDKRKDATVLYKGGPSFGGMNYDPSWSNTGFNVRKFLVPKSIAPTYDSSPLNFNVLRYSDVLLMKAEALNELGQTSASETPLNEVRTRAGLSGVSGLNQSNMRLKILHERRMELAFEGQRWFDLISHPDYALNFLHSIGRTNATKNNFLLPIPQKAIDANPNLTQNPGY